MRPGPIRPGDFESSGASSTYSLHPLAQIFALPPLYVTNGLTLQ